MLRAFLIALQFLTRLPLPKHILHESDYQPEQLGKSVVMYPIVGLIIGVVLVMVSLVLYKFFPQLPNLVWAAIILATWVLLTGALHLDGLSDSADAWVGGYGDKDKTLAIMKDPYCGPAGVTIIVVFLLLKFAALTALSVYAWGALLLAPVIARSSILLLFMTTVYVRKDGIGVSHAANMPRGMAWSMLVLVIAACAYVIQVRVLWVLLVVAVVFGVLRYLMVKRIGGTTGDTAGAMVEMVEVGVLLGLVLVQA